MFFLVDHEIFIYSKQQTIWFTHYLKSSYWILGFSSFKPIYACLHFVLHCYFFFVSFYASLNRLKFLSACYKIVPLETAQDLSSDFFEWSCTVVINFALQNHWRMFLLRKLVCIWLLSFKTHYLQILPKWQKMENKKRKKYQ